VNVIDYDGTASVCAVSPRVDLREVATTCSAVEARQVTQVDNDS